MKREIDNILSPSLELDAILTQSLNRSLHLASLQLANLYGELYILSKSPLANDDHLLALNEVLLAYRGIRRCITVNPATNKRYGASQADAMIRGDIE
jgi:hypothetical protein